MVEKTKKGKKRWIKIYAPAEFKNTFLGESYVIDPERLIGKTIQLSLSNIIGDMKKQNTLVTFKIKEIKGAEAHTSLISYEIIKSHIKRLVRTGQEKIEDSFILKSKDQMSLRIKPLMITRNKAKNSILTRIRMATKDRLTALFSENEFQQATNELISGKFQYALRHDLNKIYPVVVLEIRKIELINR